LYGETTPTESLVPVETDSAINKKEEKISLGS
jgi:hypothetical protein